MNSEVLKNGTERVKRVDFGDMYVCVDNIPVARSRRERDHHLQARAEWYVIKYNLKGYYKGAEFIDRENFYLQDYWPKHI